MKLFLNMCPSPTNFSDKRVNAGLIMFLEALHGGEDADLSQYQLTLVNRVDQATQKVTSSNEIQTLSELLTLGRYGAGSIGLFISDVFDAPALEKCSETLFIAKFLVEVAVAANRYNNLIPNDLLKETNTSRSDIGFDTNPVVFEQLFFRAHSMIEQVSSHFNRADNGELLRYLTQHKFLTKKYLHKLSGQNPIGCKFGLSWWEKFLLTTRIGLFIQFIFKPKSISPDRYS